MAKRKIDVSPEDPERSPTCYKKVKDTNTNTFKDSKYYYPGCFMEYKNAFIKCDSDSDCVGIVKHIVDPNADTMRYFNHAPDGYYLCRHNFTISQLFFDVNQNAPPYARPKEVYKKKSGKGKSKYSLFNLYRCLLNRYRKLHHI